MSISRARYSQLWPLLANALVLTLAAAGCQFRRDNPYDPKAPRSVRARATLTGEVQLEEAIGAHEIFVTAETATDATDTTPYVTQTNPDGTFELELPDGAYNVDVTSAGYKHQYFNNVTLDPGASLSLGTITLELARGIVQGVVQLAGAGDEPGGPAVGAQVFVTRVDVTGYVDSRFTDPNGVFRFPDVPEGQYQVLASLDTYAPAYTPTPQVIAGDAVNDVPPLTLYPAAAIVQITVDGLPQEFTAGRGVTVNLLRFVESLTKVKVSLDPTFADPAAGDVDARNYIPTLPFQLADTDGLQAIYAIFIDDNGRESDVYSASITLDREPPVVTNLIINNGVGFLTADSATVQAEGFDGLSGIRGYRISVDGVLDSEVERGAASPSTTATEVFTQAFPGDDGLRTVLFAWVDRAGNESVPSVDGEPPSIVNLEIDRQLPTVTSFTVEPSADQVPVPGAGYTRKVTVNLVLDVAGATQMRISNSADYFGTDWRPFASPVAWEVTPGDGKKDVHLMLRDDAHNTTADLTASISLDATPPSSLDLEIAGGAPRTNTHDVSITMHASDTNSGLRMVLATNGSFTQNDVGGVPDYETLGTHANWHLSAGEGFKVVYGRVRDIAGNTADTSASIEVDTIGPSGTVQVLTPVITNQTAVSLQVDSVGAVLFKITGDLETTTGNVGLELPYPPTVQPIGVVLDTTNCNPAAEQCSRSINVVFKDATGNSTTAQATITFDVTRPPVPTVLLHGIVADGADSTTLTGVRAIQVAVTTAATDVTKMFLAEASTPAPTTGSAWQDLAATTGYTLQTATDGVGKPVYVWLKDAAGNISATAGSATIELDTTKPRSPSIILAGGASLTNNSPVAAALGIDTASESLGIWMRVAQDVDYYTTATWAPYAATASVPITTGTGRKVVFAAFRDAAGNETALVNDYVDLDSTPPDDPTVSINGGAALTNSTSVTLTITCASSDVDKMRVMSDVASGIWGGWLPYAGSTTVTIPGGDCAPSSPGCKEVRVQVKDLAGNPSVGFGSDTITLDTAAPAAPTVVLHGVIAGGADSTVLSGTRSLQVYLSGVGADVTHMLIAESASTNTGPTAAWQVEASPAPYALQSTGDGTAKPVYVWLRDGAGNVSPYGTATLELDTSPPTAPSILLASGAAAISTSPVTAALGINVASETHGIWMRVAQDVDFAAATWTPFATSSSVPLSSGDATKTVQAQFRDAAGNLTTIVSDTVDLDTTPPANPTVSINAGATYATATSVTLTVACSSGDVDKLRVMTDIAGGVWGSWVSFSTTVAAVLPSGDCAASNPGCKEVRVQVMDKAGNPSASYGSDTITLDTHGPVALSILPANGTSIGAHTTIDLVYDEEVDPGTVALTGSLTTGASPSSVMNFDGDGFSVVAGTAWTGGTGKTLAVNVKDFAGNSATVVSLTYTVDATNPTWVLSPTTGATVTTSQVFTVTFSEAIDQDTGDWTAGGTLAAEAGAVTWTSDRILQLSPPTGGWTGGVKTFTLSARDMVGNPATAVNASYTIDNVPPTLASTVPDSSLKLSARRTLELHFSEAMNTGSVTLSGTLGASTASPSTWNAGHDILSIIRSADWPEGSGKTLTVNGADVVGNLMTAVPLTFTVDATPPAAPTPSPATTVAIGTGRSISLTFGEPIDVTRIVLGGTLGTVATKSPTTGTTTTVTVSPTTSWPAGDDQILSLTFEDDAGNSTSTSFTYDVLGDTVYVKRTDATTLPHGSAANPGTAGAPLDTIAAAIARATSITPPATQIKIAQGSWDTLADSPAPILVPEGLSLRGGYCDSGWGTRSLDTCQTVIRGIDGANDGTATAPVALVACDLSHGPWALGASSTVIEGLVVRFSSASFTHAYGAAVFLDTGCAAALTKNRLGGGRSSGASFAIFSKGTLLAENNLVSAGEATNSLDGYGALIRGDAILRNNTFYTLVGDAAKTAYGLYLDTTAAVVVQNNILFTRNSGASATKSFAVFENAVGTLTLANNDLIGDHLYGRTSATGSCEGTNLCWDTVAALETSGTGVTGASGNILVSGGTSGDSLFTNWDGADTDVLTVADNDWHLKDGADVKVRRGGLDGAANGFDFTDDRGGVTRTNASPASNTNAGGWSMGAYENNN